jgi:hypothetical protein
MEILSETEIAIKTGMKGSAEIKVKNRRRQEITADEYIRFFGKKWEAIADHLELEYKQKVEGK